MEQGLGDMLQFIRYAPLVKQRGGTVIVECPRILLPLFSTCQGIDQLVAEGDPLPDFEVQAPLMSLPRLLKTTSENVPATVPYFFPDLGLVEKWQQRLACVGGLKIGHFLARKSDSSMGPASSPTWLLCGSLKILPPAVAAYRGWWRSLF
jgi:hypothetical protein